MANLSKLKNSGKKRATKNRFADLSTEDKTSNNLEAPEHAPAPPKQARGKTGRTVSFATRVTPEFLKEFKSVAFHQELKLVELLEEAFEAYKEKRGLSKGKL